MFTKLKHFTEYNKTFISSNKEGNINITESIYKKQ